MDVIQPVCWPWASISGETYRRASNSVPFLRCTRTWKPPTSMVLPRKLFAQLGVQQHVVVVVGPIGVGRHLAHQLGLAPARHLAEGGIHIGDAALHVQRAHAGEHGVFHGAAEVGFGHQRLLGALAAAGVAPGGQQHPCRHRTQRAHQPEQAAADHAQRGAVGLRTQHQAVADGGDGCLRPRWQRCASAASSVAGLLAWLSAGCLPAPGPGCRAGSWRSGP